MTSSTREAAARKVLRETKRATDEIETKERERERESRVVSWFIRILKPFFVQEATEFANQVNWMVAHLFVD